ncbi:MAG: hypothetical protein QNK37_22190 [Acidobacteriota bacterium]|nr:hypothetical protein [Acidobacteriota bacterium]
MQNIQGSNHLLPIITVVFTAILGGSFLLETPFETLRSPETKLRSFEGDNLEDLDARLWQDPLAVAHDNRRAFLEKQRTHKLADKANAPPIESNTENRLNILAREVARYLALNPAQNLLLLPVSVTGSPYAEDAEHRRRIRHAVLSGLAIEGYVPEQSEHLGYVDLTFPESWHQVKQAETLVPFEWYTLKEGTVSMSSQANPLQPFFLKDQMLGDYDRVLVLWLNEDAFDQVAKLRFFLASVLGHRFLKDIGGQSAPNNVAISYLGPFGSHMLKSFVEESKRPNKLSFPELPKKPDLVKHADPIASRLVSQWIEPLEPSKRPRFSDLEPIKQDIATSLIDFWEKQTHEGIHGQLSDLKKSLTRTLKAKIEGTPLNGAWEKALQQTIMAFPNTFYGQTIPHDDLLPDDIRLFACYPTASIRELLPGETYPQQVLINCLKKLGFSEVYPIIAQDDALADTLVEELNRRVDIINQFKHEIRQFLEPFQKESKKSEVENRLIEFLIEFEKEPFFGSMVLIGEWDTFYARSLLSAVKKAATDHFAIEDDILELRYLQGLDGIIPDGDTTQASQLPITGPTREERARLEQPVHRAQLDYVRRLAGQLELWNRKQSREKRITAIGVLGSDFYDKQLILQALKPRFPEATFFTTDLDARLLHPDQYQWARNVIVASGFGLKLEQSLQGNVSPFRTSYQTGTFLATRFLLQRDANEEERLQAKVLQDESGHSGIANQFYPDEADPLASGPQYYRSIPGVYEVARSGAFPLVFNQSGRQESPRYHEQKPDPTLNLFLRDKWALFIPFLILVIWQGNTYLVESWRKVILQWLSLQQAFLKLKGSGFRGILKKMAEVRLKKLLSALCKPFSILNPFGMKRRLRGFRASTFFKRWLFPALLLLRLMFWFGGLIILSFFYFVAWLLMDTPTPWWLQAAYYLAPVVYLMRSYFTPFRRDDRLSMLLLQYLLILGIGYAVYQWFIFVVANEKVEQIPYWCLTTLFLFVFLAPPLPRLVNRTGRFLMRLSPVMLWGAVLAVLVTNYQEENPLDSVFLSVCVALLALHLVLRKVVDESLLRPMDNAIPGTILLIQVALGDHQTGEPFMLSGGISAWPTIFLAWASLLISIYMIVRSRTEIRANTQQIQSDFFSVRDHDLKKENDLPKYLWQSYAYKSRVRPSVGWTVLLWACFCAVMLMKTSFPKPIRSDTATIIEGFLFFGNGILLMYMAMYAMEHTRACVRFMKELAFEKELTWGAHARKMAREELRAEELVVRDKFLDDYLDIRIIIQRTRVVSNLIVYPFILVFLGLITHNTYFDNWHRPFFIYLFFGALCCYGLGCAFYLRREAECARTEAFEQIIEKRSQDKQVDIKDDVHLVRQKIKCIADGALAPWNRHPILKAVLLPLGGFSTLALAEYLILFLQ